MRKWLSGLSVLALGVTAMAQDTGETKKKESVPAKKIVQPGQVQKAELTEAQKKLSEIQKEFGKLNNEAMKDYLAAKPEDRQKLIPETQAKLNKLPRAEFAQKALDLAKKTDAKDPASFMALQFAMQMGVSKPEIAKESQDLLMERHADHPGFGQVLSMIANSGPEGIKKVEKIAKESKAKATQGNAYMILAQNYQQSSTRPGLAQEKVDELSKKAEDLFEKIAKDYADVSSGRGTLGQTAKGALNEMKFLKIGKPAPEVTCLNIDGDKEDKLSNYKGKIVVLDIWATWCGPCVAMIPHEREMVERLKGKGFALISVSGDDEKETLTKFLEKTKMPWTHWFAEKKGILKDWNIRYFPTIYVIDHKGVIRAKDLRGEQLEEKVNELIAEMEKEKKG